MTETTRRLARLARPHARARVAAAVLAGAGVVLLAGAAGLALAPRPAAVIGAWLAILAAAGAAGWAAWRERRAPGTARLGSLVEEAAGARRGSVRGLLEAEPPRGTSAALFAAADRRGVAAVESATPALRRRLGRTGALRLAVGSAVALTGAALFVAAAPASGRAAGFWRPLATWRAARAPVRLTADRSAVRRGEFVSVTVAAPGALHATLWTRAPGEPWQTRALALDAAGRAAERLGPLESDLVLRATAGGRASDTLRVRVTAPLFAGDLEILARFPSYIDRPDEPLVPGSDAVPLPAGTRIAVRGQASGRLAGARWNGPGQTGALTVRADRFDGTFVPRRSGAWMLELTPAVAGQVVEPIAPLALVIVPDSAPTVAVPVPGQDTTAPISMRQPLVVDARDDHGLTQVEIVSWRVSQTGRVGAPVREHVPVADGGDRVIVQGELVLEERGLLPGDTLRFFVEAWDNAPAPQRGRSREFVLRLPSRAELRAAARDAAAAVAATADSVTAAQRDLADRVRDLGAARARGDAAGGAAARPEGALGFEASERATQLVREQAELQARAGELAQAVADLARAAEAAGLEDSAFLARLEEVRALLERALTPELERRMRELQEALQRLDPEAAREALQRLAEAQQQLRDDLERSRELFQRAALEGALSTLAADAAELARRQEEWTRTEARRADSAAAAAERALGAQADSLRAALAQTARELAATAPGDRGALRGPDSAAARARDAMTEAEAAAAAGEAQRAGRSGEAATGALDALAAELRRGRDSVASAWRGEALAALDRALAETAALAARQADVAAAMGRGETGAGVRAQQGSVEDGTAAVERQVREAAGRNALVSPQLESALGFAQRQMRGAREQLTQALPNAAAAAALADEALDALNATAHALARARGEVAGAQSGTGFAEALEQLARLAARQRGLAGEGQGLLPLLGQGGQAVLQQLRALAAQQRALAEQLEQLHASGGGETAGALAAEARELARQLDAGRLDRQTVARQERLYRRLLDAGRTLTGEEPDPERERTSRAARDVPVRRPPALGLDASGAPRLRYPRWEDLRGLTPEERRLVLEYYRRLNEPPR